jgi:hypothetical protein
MGAKWIEVKGKRVMYGDYRGLTKTEDLIAVIQEEAKLCSENTGVLFLDDFRDSFVTQDFMNIAKELGSKVFKDRTAKAAMLGITGAKKLLLSIYNRITGGKIRLFDTEEGAKEYLTS